MCGLALQQGAPNLFFVLLPTVAIQSLISIIVAVYYIFAYEQALTRYPLLVSLNASQLVTLAFVYSFGYFAPTIAVLQSGLGRIAGTDGDSASLLSSFLIQFIAGNLAYDLIFTVGLSATMLGRKSLKEMSASLYLPVILCIVGLVFANNFDTARGDAVAGEEFSRLEMKIDETNGEAL